MIHAAKNKVSFMVFDASDIEAVEGVFRSMGNGERKTADIAEGEMSTTTCSLRPWPRRAAPAEPAHGKPWTRAGSVRECSGIAGSPGVAHEAGYR
ncbi:hypothetical protein [Nocardia flavorosea]|uniref:hypothetical protein n=1 Tax=Nocardia flavorosea TaxID=53429 RepID=UPI001E376A13|nr:hypothetical protein [Nocardia flavorosea]